MSSKAHPATPASVQVNTRVPADLFARFQAACAAEDITVSQRLRRFMRGVVAAHERATGAERA